MSQSPVKGATQSKLVTVLSVFEQYMMMMVQNNYQVTTTGTCEIYKLFSRL